MKNLYSALIEFQSKCPKVTLDGQASYATKTGARVNFKYATLGNIVATATPILSEVGLGFYQQIIEGTLKTVLFHVDGEQLESSTKIPSYNKPQDLGSWLTYMKRYQLASIVGIVAEDDNDGQTGEPPVDGKKSDEELQSLVMKVQELTIEMRDVSDGAKMYGELMDIYKKNEKFIKENKLNSLFKSDFDKAKTAIKKIIDESVEGENLEKIYSENGWSNIPNLDDYYNSKLKQLNNEAA